MKIIETDKAVLVEVPEGAESFKIFDRTPNRLYMVVSDEFGGTTKSQELPAGRYEVLGMADKVSNDDFWGLPTEIMYDARQSGFKIETTLILKKIEHV